LCGDSASQMRLQVFRMKFLTALSTRIGVFKPSALQVYKSQLVLLLTLSSHFPLPRHAPQAQLPLIPLHEYYTMYTHTHPRFTALSIAISILTILSASRAAVIPHKHRQSTPLTYVLFRVITRFHASAALFSLLSKFLRY